MQPTLFALPVVLLGLLVPARALPGALVFAALFGATAAVSLTALGGAPITPAALLLGFAVARALQRQGAGAVIAQLAPAGAGLWLLLLVLWGVAGAWFLPRLFAGQTLVYATDRLAPPGVHLLPLMPRLTNVSQAFYAVAALAAFLAAAALLQLRGSREAFRDAVLWVAGLNIVAAAINLVEVHTGAVSLLEVVRNAGYAIIVGGEVAGLQRISGTFSEASAFAAFTLPLFAFCLTLWRERERRVATSVLALATLVVIVLSTSSTAYVGLGAYLALAAVPAAWRLLTRPQLRLGAGAWVLWGAAVAACLFVLLRPDLVERVWDVVAVTVVRKLETSSGIERSSWNAQAWQNLLDTHGIGIGLGSTRASSFVLVLLSNFGVLGALLFAAFLWRVVRPLPGGAPQDAVARAARHAVVAGFLAAAVSASVFDLGVAFYVYAAAAAARAAQVRQVHTAQVRHAAA